MRKHRIIPEGYITAEQAAKILGMPISTFYRRCNAKNPRLKLDIETAPSLIGREKLYNEACVKALTTPALTPVYTFKVVENEMELRGIVDLCVPIFGAYKTLTFQQRLVCWRDNPRCYYIVVQEGIVVAYATTAYLTQDLLDKLMKPINREELYKSHPIDGHNLPFVQGKPIPHLFVSVAVRKEPKDPSDLEKRRRGFALIQGLIREFCCFKQQGMPIEILYAVSDTDDGMALAKKLGMHAWTYEDDEKIRYSLDPEASTCLALKPYRETKVGMDI